MISIRSELNELERSHRLTEAALDCCLNPIRNVGHYALDLDPELAKQFRKNVAALADDVATDAGKVLDDSRATFRALLPDYRDRCAVYVANLRDELAGTARALEEILDSLNQTEGDHEIRLKSALVKLRDAAAADPTGTLGAIVAGAADSMEESVEELKKQHQLSISRFMTEIRVLHQRIDSLEKAASVDRLTMLPNRTEMIERIRLSVAGEYCLVLVGARGLLPRRGAVWQRRGPGARRRVRQTPAQQHRRRDRSGPLERRGICCDGPHEEDGSVDVGQVDYREPLRHLCMSERRQGGAPLDTGERRYRGDLHGRDLGTDLAADRGLSGPDLIPAKLRGAAAGAG
jgi:hypothetical protein